jgi:hypothetical protein
MISKSFSLFFSNPLKELYQGFISQLKFIFEFTIDTALLRNIQSAENYHLYYCRKYRVQRNLQKR